MDCTMGLNGVSMRLEIFNKAEKLKDKVVEEGSMRDKAYFTFKTEDAPAITLSCDGRKTIIETCTCKHCSVHDGVSKSKGQLMLCSYKIALMKHLGRA